MGILAIFIFTVFPYFLIFCSRHAVFYKQIADQDILKHTFTPTGGVGERVVKTVVIYRILMQMGNKHIK